MSRADERRPSEREAIEATAAAWLAEVDGGMAPERAAEFARWRAADARHEAAVARLEHAWGALCELRDFRPEAQRHPEVNLLGQQRKRRAGGWGWPALVGFALAAALALPMAWQVASRDAGTGELRFATTSDGYERVKLADGSMVELNAASEIVVTYQAARRSVQLRRGEAHFTVAKDASRPFTVQAGSVAVRAVGTAFNVRLGTADVEVLVTQGQVEVSTAEPGAALLPAPTALAANQRTRLAARKQRSAPQVEDLPADAIRAALAWQGARLVFVDTPLAEAVEQFNRRNRAQLVIADAELHALPIGGSFRADNVDGFVRLLETGAEIVADRSDPARTVLRKGK